ncbi:MAG: DUF86 domain-containing protein [Proteobacteria bacterium]|nr:DUF86 domain-containing protein [Pseudomonadota bacterium]MBU1568955.1 DUF86 domain-containing protein [Pseudomonadota bacterium]
MISERLYIDYLRDILDNAKKASDFIKGMTENDFLRDEKTIFAVIRALEIVGEATKKIPDEVRGKYPGIPWREMTGMRNKLIHDYFGVNLAVIWKTVTEDMPKLIPLVKQVIEDQTSA